MINKFSDIIRSNHWWKYKAAHILGFTYFFFYLIQPSKIEAALLFLFSAMTIVGIAGLGYFINDLYDIKFDLKAGKKNHVHPLSLFVRFLIVFALLAISFLPWLYLRSTIWIWLLIGVELLLFVVYAHPLTRLKEKAQWGLICDSLYGHALPIIIACLTYWQYLDKVDLSPKLFFLFLFVWQFTKGIRNILLHQLTDYQNDLKSGIKTFTSINNPHKIYRFVLFRLVPFEFIWNLIFLVFIYKTTSSLLIGFVIFLIVFIAGHGLFRNIKINKTEYQENTYLYFLNDWYEDYFPIIILVTLLINQPNLWLLILGHVILFPSAFVGLFRDIKACIKQCYFFLFDIKRWLGFKENVG